MVNNLPANTGDAALIPGLGRSPREGNGNPLQYSCLGNPVDGGAWQAAWDHKRVGHDLASKQQKQQRKEMPVQAGSEQRKSPGEGGTSSRP